MYTFSRFAQPYQRSRTAFSALSVEIRSSDIRVIISAYRIEKSAIVTRISSVTWSEGSVISDHPYNADYAFVMGVRP
jgi:hypothetical protein